MSLGRIPLQQTLEDKHLKRSFSTVCDIFKKGGFDLYATILEKLMHSGDSEVTTLDIGCGPGGVAVEGLVKGLVHTASFLAPHKVVKGIGVDLHPYDDASPDQRASELRVGDACNMPVDDNSVDVFYSSNVLQYVADVLKSFEEGYRVLKPGGVGVWQVAYRDISIAPKFDSILNFTPGGRESFVYVPTDEEMGFVICRKNSGDAFKGFPFNLMREVTYADLEGGRPTEVDELANYYRNAIYARAIPS